MKKEEQRELILSKLDELDKDLLIKKSGEVSSILFEFLKKFNNPNTLIGFFMPMKNEVIWHDKFKEGFFEYSFPSIEEEYQMNFYRVAFKDLRSLDYKANLSESFERVYPKVLVIPGLGFDKEGRRLGRGKGYYDRYLAKRDILKIGVCFEEQILEKVVIDNKDVLMDYIVTENTVFKGNK